MTRPTRERLQGIRERWARPIAARAGEDVAELSAADEFNGCTDRIGAAPDDIASLLAEIDALTAERDALRAVVQAFADRARAEVAGAYEAASKSVRDQFSGDAANAGVRIAKYVEALVPADAKAALDALLAKARAEGKADAVRAFLSEGDDDPTTLASALATARAEGAAAEREACAKECEQRVWRGSSPPDGRAYSCSLTASECAARIRARGEKP